VPGRVRTASHRRLSRGNLAHFSGLAKLVKSWPAAGLLSESDTLARDWLIMVSLIDDGQFAAQVGELIDPVLPDARRLEQPWRWAMMLMIRAAARPYAVGSAARPITRRPWRSPAAPAT
jgi:hypothetical protein